MNNNLNNNTQYPNNNLNNSQGYIPNPSPNNYPNPTINYNQNIPSQPYYPPINNQNANNFNPTNMFTNPPQNINPNPISEPPKPVEQPIPKPITPQELPKNDKKQDKKERKEKKELSTTTSVIATIIMMIIIFACTLYILSTLGYVTFNFGKEQLNTNNNNHINSEPNINENNVTSNYSESDFVRETNLTLIEEPTCSGNSESLLVSISSGNIILSRGTESKTIELNNAKYLYSVNKLTCDNISLYYITENNELYQIDNPSSLDETLNPTKITESQVVEFLGTSINEEGSILTVLLKDGNTEDILYLPNSE